MTSGRRLGSRYELDALLGRGGMGEVYRGRTLDDGNAVAIKVLKPELVADRKIVARFIQERDILTALDHPNLVRVRDLVVEGNELAIVMDLVEGGDLRKLLATRGGTLRPAEALDLAAQIFDALEVVHRAQIVHRDVKPENILLPAGDRLVAHLSDFGVARVTGDRGVSTTHTSLIGTPYYMAPELADGRPVSAAADIYSTGMTLYELIAGTVAFTGSPLLVLRRHADEEPQPIPGLPADVWRFLEALLAKEPSGRPDAAAAAAVCRQLARRHAPLAAFPPMAPPSPRVRSTGGSELRASWTGTTPPPAGQYPGPGAVGPSGDGTTVYRPRTAPPEDDFATVHRRHFVAPGLDHTAAAPVPVVAPVAPRRWLRPALVAGAAVLVLVALVAGVLALRDDGSQVVVTAVRHATTPFIYKDGHIVTTKWTLDDGEVNQLVGEVVITNSANTSTSGTFEVFVPKSIASTVDDITFSPQPDRVVNRDPIVAYDYKDLKFGESRSFRYEATVPASDTPREDRLNEWAKEVVGWFKQRYPTGTEAKLSAIAFSAPTVTLDGIPSMDVGVTATDDKGQAASAALMSLLVFSSSDETVAKVAATASPNVVRIEAVGAGSATITASSGSVRATLPVAVSNPSVTSDPRPTTPTTPTIPKPTTPTNPEPTKPTIPEPTTPTNPEPTTPTIPEPTTPTIPDPPTPQPPVVVPTCVNNGGNGQYPAENAEIVGSAASKDCANAGYRGSGYIGNWLPDTEVRFTVNVGSGGRHNVVVRFNNAGDTSTRTVTTSAGGGSATVRFTNTTSGVRQNWNPGVWNRAVVNVVLNAGSNTITLQGGAGYVDLDEISSITRTGSSLPGSVTSSQGGVIHQAETAALSGERITAADGHVGMFGLVGDRVTFNGVTGGVMRFRYRCPAVEGSPQRLIYVNGSSVALVTLSCTPGSGGNWGAAQWNEVSVAYPVPPGSTVAIEFIGTDWSGFIDLDYMAIV